MRWKQICEIERGGEINNEPQWDRISKGDVDARQGDLFPQHDKEYDVEGQFDGYDVAIFNGNLLNDDGANYVLFRGSVPVAYIALVFSWHEGEDNSFKVKSVRIAPQEQGKGLAPRFYHWLLTDGHIDRLYADDHQTDGGAKIWERLLKQPGIWVFLMRADAESLIGKRVKTVRGLAKVWQTDRWELYAEAI